MEMAPEVRKYCQVLLHLLMQHLFGGVAVCAFLPLIEIETEIEIEVLVVNRIVLQCVCMCACVPPSSSQT